MIDKEQIDIDKILDEMEEEERLIEAAKPLEQRIKEAEERKRRRLEFARMEEENKYARRKLRQIRASTPKFVVCRSNNDN